LFRRKLLAQQTTVLVGRTSMLAVGAWRRNPDGANSGDGQLIEKEDDE